MGLGAVCQSGAGVVTALTALAWILAGARMAWGSRRLRSLAKAEPLDDPSLPSLAIIATAKDEAGRVGRAARSLLAQDYPRFSVTIVDDRSTDGTGAILDRLAEEDRRLRVLHIESLPAGWIGKCHALARAVAAPSAGSGAGHDPSAGSGVEWLLFTDGDVDFSPDAARRAVSLALREGADHVAVGPDMVVESLGEAVFLGFFIALFYLSALPWRAEDPRSKASIGIGAFNLVRRDLYERAGGHERIRFDLLDDLALGKILKRAGARQLFTLHGDRVRAKWHAGARGLIRGVEKNAFPAVHYRTGLAICGAGGLLVLALVPVAGIYLPGLAPKAASAAAWVGIALVYGVTSRTVRIRPWQAILMPVGAILFAYALLRSTFVTLARGGVVWRGTFYPLRELKRGRVW